MIKKILIGSVLGFIFSLGFIYFSNEGWPDELFAVEYFVIAWITVSFVIMAILLKYILILLKKMFKKG